MSSSPVRLNQKIYSKPDPPPRLLKHAISIQPKKVSKRTNLTSHGIHMRGNRFPCLPPCPPTYENNKQAQHQDLIGIPSPSKEEKKKLPLKIQ
jgi:hypothetical protein